jgi:hypothetical protein
VAGTSGGGSSAGFAGAGQSGSSSDAGEAGTRNSGNTAGSGDAADAGAGGEVGSTGAAPQGGAGSQGGTGSGGGAGPTGGARSGAGAGGEGGTAGAGRAGGVSSSGGAAGVGGAGDDLPTFVPPGYALVYDQSFREPASFDELLIANEAEWFHSPQGFVEFTAATYAPPYRSPFSVALIEGLSASSFVLEVELWQTGVGEAHRDMVILWNMVSPSEFYYAHISEQHDDVAHHIHIVNFADRTAITQAFTPGFDWGTDAWRTLRVVRDAESGLMEVHDVDEGVLVLSASDTTFTTGFFGVGSFDNTGRVRNLKIWSPDATQTDIPFTF